MLKSFQSSVERVGNEVGQWLWSNLNNWLTSKSILRLEHEVIGGLVEIEEGLHKYFSLSIDSVLTLTFPHRPLPSPTAEVFKNQ